MAGRSAAAAAAAAALMAVAVLQGVSPGWASSAPDYSFAVDVGGRGTRFPHFWAATGV